MTKFLERVAQKIISLKEASAETAVIVPNKRSALFLKDIIKHELNQHFWLPEFFSSDSFFQRATGFTNADPFKLALDLYFIHQKIAGKSQRSLEDFLAWSPVMISDFNDVDLNLADAEKLFHHLSANKAIQEWNLDGSPLTEMQLNYLNFYRSLWDYYQQLRSGLLEKKLGYPGLIYRYLAENFDELKNNWSWKHFVVAGMNALSPAETALFKKLNESFDVTFIWDVDSYYYSPSAQPAANPDPGRFIQHFINQLHLPKPEVIDNLLTTDQKTIDVVGIQGEIAQTKFAGEWIKNQIESIQTEEITLFEDELKKIAIVLTDEELLVPLLNTLPPVFDRNGDEKKYNITMGYPLKNSPYELLLQQWIKLLNQPDQNQEEILSLHLVDFIQNCVVQSVLNHQQPGFTANLIHTLNTDNLNSITHSEFQNLFGGTSAKAVDQLRGLISRCSGIEFMNKYHVLLTEYHAILRVQKPASSLEQHQLLQAIRVSNTLKRRIELHREAVSLKAAHKVLLQFIRSTQVHLSGQPLEGIQVMGLLETRNLDFEKILVLSANEGTLPANSQSESFIPFDIRHQFNLPLPHDSQDVTSYHFYRLLQRTKKATFVYNSGKSGLGSNEVSRFLLQVENELVPLNPQITFKSHQLSLPVTTEHHHHSIEVKKSEDVMNKLFEVAAKGLSPSALSSFIQCPLRFYFRYILKIYPPETVEQSMESNTFGTIVHGVLEQIYLPLVNKPIDPATLRLRLSDINRLIEDEYRKLYKGKSPLRGKNLLMMQVTKKMIRQTILNDCILLETEPRLLLGVEQTLSTTVDTAPGQVRLEGKIDRIDMTQSSGEVRIIDYKTGSVTPNDLKIKEIELLTNSPDFPKAFQLMQYALMYSDAHPGKPVTAGNISLRNHTQGFISPQFPDTFSSSMEALVEFKTNLIQLIENMLDKNQSFCQTENKDLCTFCDYKQICNRT
ncbi:MAG: PD-(D/E)XK nuclease family protein [Bacteroidales bacterium]|nr:PD-(D/E)XK nuclease family protein [Bacteroidales bacterium]